MSERDPKHKHFDLLFSEWIELLPGNLAIDAVALADLVEICEDSFGFSGDELWERVRRCVEILLRSGAVPVLPEVEQAFYLDGVVFEKEDPAELAESIVAELSRSNEQPDLNGIWFSKP